MVYVPLRAVCRNPVLAVGIDHHVEVKITKLDEAIDKHHRMLKVHIVVTSAVAEKDAPPSQVFSALDNTPFVVYEWVDRDC